MRFWQPVMEDGVIEFLPPKECTVTRHIRPMEVKPFGRELGNFSGLEEPELDLLAGGEEFELG